MFCASCLARIKPVVSHTIGVTKTKQMRVLAVGAYQDPLSALILAKSSSQHAVSVKLGDLLWKLSNVQHMPFDYIVPIPLHWTRYAWRGYNQAEEIARVVSKQSNKPVVHLLKRIKRTPYLSSFSSDQRAQNMQNVFRLCTDTDEYHGKRILLVDDVMTTGTTLTQAAKELWKLKPVSITAAVIARVVK